MELDFSELDSPWLSAAVFAVLGGLLLALLGRAVSPDRLLTWSEWQVIQQSRAYTRELNTLVQHANRLAEITASSPDAVRASVARDQIYTLEGIPALEAARAQLRSAADAVLAWTQGDTPQAAAAEAVDALLNRLTALGSANE